jgi:hypothetical protein
VTKQSTIRNPQSAIRRDDALLARPVQVPPVSTEEKNARLYVTVQYKRPGWQRFLGADTYCQRTYGLDAYGREVYSACNGKSSVKEIIRRFAKAHRLSRPEAEKAVTTFMRTLMSRGLIGMAMKNGVCRMPNDTQDVEKGEARRK